MDRLTEKINELHSTLDYADYSELIELTYELKAENEQLKAKIEETKQVNEPSFERLRELNIITSFIPIDRLKEICDRERAAKKLKEVGNETSKN